MRRAHGLSQNKLAELAGVDRRTIIDIENKPGYRPNVAIALKLAELLDTTTERLFWEEAVA